MTQGCQPSAAALRVTASYQHTFTYNSSRSSCRSLRGRGKAFAGSDVAIQEFKLEGADEREENVYARTVTASEVDGIVNSEDTV